MSITWDRWVGNNSSEPVYFQKKLFSAFGWTLRLHKFVKADDPGCFHTHPAYAYRFVLWGGYIEETMVPQCPGPEFQFKHRCAPGFHNRIAPWFCHRIDSLINGRVSYSLWLHGPKMASIELHGDGWPADLDPQFSAKRVLASPSGGARRGGGA